MQALNPLTGNLLRDHSGPRLVAKGMTARVVDLNLRRLSDTLAMARKFSFGSTRRRCRSRSSTALSATKQVSRVDFEPTFRVLPQTGTRRCSD